MTSNDGTAMFGMTTAIVDIAIQTEGAAKAAERYLTEAREAVGVDAEGARQALNRAKKAIVEGRSDSTRLLGDRSMDLMSGLSDMQELLLRGHDARVLEAMPEAFEILRGLDMSRTG